MSHTAAWMVVAAVAAIAGSAKFFTAREKHRRARADLRAGLAGIDGLAGQVRAAARTIVNTLGLVALVLLILGVLIYIGGHKS